jgi:SH3 domain-containing protein/PEGA domain-containing protein
MKRYILIVFLASVFLGGCSLSPKRSAIEINSYPIAKVYINGEEKGMTPYKNRNLKPGENKIELVNNDKRWSKNVKLQNNVNTVIDWNFGNESDESGGYILFLEKTGDKKNAGLMVISNPSEATLSIDNEIKGFSPNRIKNIGEGDRHLNLSFPGYKNIDVFVKAINGYQLVIETTLAKEKVKISEKEEVKKVDEVIDNSDLLSEEEKVVIEETGTGWLRVRELASKGSKEIDKVTVGESYVLLEEEEGWYKIEVEDGVNGWISASYAEKE